MASNARYFQPTKPEIARRERIVTLIEDGFVLTNDNDPTSHIAYGDIVDNARVAVDMMLRLYPETKTGTNTSGRKFTAAQSAIHDARNALRGVIPVDTFDASGKKSEEGAPFGLAMVWFNHAIVWAEAVLSQLDSNLPVAS